MHVSRLAATMSNLDGVGSPKTPTLVDESGANKDIASVVGSSIVTLEPCIDSVIKESADFAATPILHAKPIPLDWSFDVIYREFSRFGNIKEIRNKLGNNYEYFESWIIFNNDKDALSAYKKFQSDFVSVNFCKLENIPRHLDIYKPQIQTENPEFIISKVARSPEPPRWLIVSSHSERGNLFKVKKFVELKLGHTKRPDISRFGRNSFLIQAKSDVQSAMLLNMKLDPEGLIKEVKPHYNFSYARGVIFNEDLYELSDEEILMMCPEGVYKIFKVPRSRMIILTFINSVLPSEIVIESEILRVRPYRPRVLQCFNCFGFGHASRVCTRAKICQSCSQLEHGDCSRPKVCANCKGDHDARNKSCKIFEKEQEAMLLSIAEHISIGHAKKLLAKRSYSDAVKESKPNSTSYRTANSISPNTDTGTSRASRAGAPQASSGGAQKILLRCL